MPSSLPDLLLLDLDGTLIDSEGLAVDAVQEELVELGAKKLTPGEEGRIVGVRWETAAKWLVATRAIDLDAVVLERRLIERFRNKTGAGVLPVRGVQEALRALSNRLRLFVVSGSQCADIEYALRSMKLTDCIERIVGAEDYSQGKPSPEPYLEALRLAGLPPERALAFEDSEVGIHSALGAGLDVVAVTGAHRIAQDTRRARWHVADFTGVDASWLAARWKEGKSSKR